MYRMVFPNLVGLNFRLFSLWQDRLLSPCSVGSFCCFLHTQGVGHIVCVCVPVWLVVECACVSFWSVVSFGGSVGTGIQEVEGRMQHFGQNKEDLSHLVYLFRFATKAKSCGFII